MSFSRKPTHIHTKKPNIFIRFIKLCIWIAILLSWYLYLWYSNFSSGALVWQQQEINIKKWDTFQTLANKLELNQKYLKFYVSQNHPDYSLKAGKFLIPENAKIDDILEALQKPIFDTINITLLEGWNIFDIDEFLANKWLIQEWEYINYVESWEKITALTKFFPFIQWVTTLEWYLYPDTYTVDPNNFAINKFVIFQLETFETKVYNTLFKNRNDISLENFQSVINLASIVEKEEKNPNYKKTVAGILKKRLQEWWMIGADITVCYPYRLTAHECKLVVSKYIRDKNDYNTRTMRWLPKTPIGNPSYHTIEATLNHTVTPYYFYLHAKDGSIYYATTNAQHERNKYLYLR